VGVELLSGPFIYYYQHAPFKQSLVITLLAEYELNREATRRMLDKKANEQTQ
jgi:hypothetical protein